jgi:hypothetical protein
MNWDLISGRKKPRLDDESEMSGERMAEGHRTRRIAFVAARLPYRPPGNEDPLIEKGRRASVWIDDAHLTAEHIDDPGEDFNSRRAKELAEPRRLAGPDRQCPLRIVRDSTETEHLKTTATSSDAAVPVEDWTRAFELDRQRDEKHQRYGDLQQCAGNHHVSETPHPIRIV